MDAREAAMASYYMHRGIGATAPPPHRAGMHGPLPGSRQFFGVGSHGGIPLDSSSAGTDGNGGGGGGASSLGCAFQVESPPSISHHGINVGDGFASGALAVPGEQAVVRKKRGRPRKYGSDGNVSLALATMPSSPIPSAARLSSGGGAGSASRSQGPKRGRGRPPGTGRKQLLASLGQWVLGSAGMGFTPHIITVTVGEDITSKLMSFSQQGPRAVCIMTASGLVSSATLRQPASSGGTATYEGIYEILSLSGSYVLADDGAGSHGRTGGLSISLSSGDGRVIGGVVGGLLVAASHVQVIVGSFVYGPKAKAKTLQQEPAAAVGFEQPMVAEPPSITPGRPLAVQAPHAIGGWPVSRQLDATTSTHIDFDLMHG